MLLPYIVLYISDLICCIVMYFWFSQEFPNLLLGTLGLIEYVRSVLKLIVSFGIILMKVVVLVREIHMKGKAADWTARFWQKHLSSRA